jgi:hypothetical protein
MVQSTGHLAEAKRIHKEHREAAQPEAQRQKAE